LYLGVQFCTYVNIQFCVTVYSFLSCCTFLIKFCEVLYLSEVLHQVAKFFAEYEFLYLIYM
jgi:hypothetical protein